MSVIQCDGKTLVTTTKPIEAYYSNYASLPECFLMPGESARIIAEKVPSVRGPRAYFTLVEFEKLGHTWRASLYPGEYKKTGRVTDTCLCGAPMLAGQCSVPECVCSNR